MSEVLDEPLSESIGIADVPRLIKEMTGLRVPYQTLYRGIINGDITATKNKTSGRWFIKKENLPEIIDFFDPERQWDE